MYTKYNLPVVVFGIVIVFLLDVKLIGLSDIIVINCQFVFLIVLGNWNSLIAGFGVSEWEG